MAKQRIAIVMPAYNAGRTLQKTYNDLPKNKVDPIILVDDGSADNTVEIALSLGLKVIRHECNRGYGASQKTGYKEALKEGADIIVMLHPDYQYDPKSIPDLIRDIENEKADIVLGSRFLYGKPLRSGMPWWRYLGNRFLTAVENLVLRLKLSEYHTGYRAYSRTFLESIPYLYNSDNFIFDQEIIIQAVLGNFRIAEISVPTRYTPICSRITFINSIIYGLGSISLMLKYVLRKKI